MQLTVHAAIKLILSYNESVGQKYNKSRDTRVYISSPSLSCPYK